MSGRSSRTRGYDWERLLANKLSEILLLDVRTTRSLGASFGADLATVTSYDARGRPVTSEPSVLGFSIEAKAVRRRVPTSWLRQAQEQMAPGLTPVVLWKRPYKHWRDGSAFLIDGKAPRGWSEQTIGEWLHGVVLDEMRGHDRMDLNDAADRLMVER